MRLFAIIVAGLLCGASAAGAEPPTTASQPLLSKAVRLYSHVYKSSTLRDLIFQDQPNPDKAICEEICLEAQLTERAIESGMTTGPGVLDSIRLRTDMEVFEAWLRNEAGTSTTDELLAYYTQHKDQFVRPAKVSFHHLFLLVKPGDEKASASKLSLAQNILRQVKEGADFEELIVRHSDLEAARHDRGAVKNAELEKLNPAVQNAMRNLEPGSFSEPVRTQYGWELLRLDSRTSESVISFEEARDTIAEQLFIQQLPQLRQTASAKLSAAYPVKVHQEVLTTHSPNPKAVLLSVGDRELTLGETSRTVVAMNAYADLPDMRQRISQFLPQLALIEQVKLSAREKGLLDTEEFTAKKLFIRNRVLAEAYMNSYISDRQPTEEQIRETYEAEKNVFRGPPYAKGTLYRWDMPAADAQSTSTASREYRETVLKDNLTSMITAVQEGRMTRQELASKADETTVLDWFREGPMGYHHDMAWFQTEPGNFTKPYIDNNSLYVGFVKARRAPEQLPLEQVRERVRVRLMNKWTALKRVQLLDELLKNCVQCSILASNPG